MYVTTAKGNMQATLKGMLQKKPEILANCGCEPRHLEWAFDHFGVGRFLTGDQNNDK